VAVGSTDLLSPELSPDAAVVDYEGHAIGYVLTRLASLISHVSALPSAVDLQENYKWRGFSFAGMSSTTPSSKSNLAVAFFRSDKA